ncbi:hypothetical protein ACW0JT_15390 [Arthrobacter sp. SA17]
MKTAAEATFDNYALAYAQRRSWVVGSWSYGAIIAASGAAYVLASAVTGNDPETGVFMTVLGGAIAGLGWLASAPKRFSRKIPKPSMDVWRAEQAIRINKPTVIVSNVLGVVIVLVITFLTPRGLAPDVIPITALVAVWAPLLGALMLRVTKLLVERGAIYDRWLQSRGAGNG